MREFLNDKDYSMQITKYISINAHNKRYIKHKQIHKSQKNNISTQDTNIANGVHDK